MSEPANATQTLPGDLPPIHGPVFVPTPRRGRPGSGRPAQERPVRLAPGHFRNSGRPLRPRRNLVACARRPVHGFGCAVFGLLCGTSQTCTHCGSRHKPSGKLFQCGTCGHSNHRDVEAAFNIAHFAALRHTPVQDAAGVGSIDGPVSGKGVGHA